MSDQPFESFADAYEATIDWPRRLANEAPFFRWLFARVGAASVLDAACGTGHHAAMFHSWGLRVEAADASATMIERCRSRHGQQPGLQWMVRTFDQPVDSPASFDAAVCIGNSLALARDHRMAADGLRALLAAVRPGGAVAVHVLNLWHLADGPCVWQKCRRAMLPQGDSLIIKGVHRSGSRGYVDLLVSSVADPPVLRSDSAPFLGIEPESLREDAIQGGAADAELYGSYQRDAYDRARSIDLILVARK